MVFYKTNSYAKMFSYRSCLPAVSSWCFHNSREIGAVGEQVHRSTFYCNMSLLQDINMIKAGQQVQAVKSFSYIRASVWGLRCWQARSAAPPCFPGRPVYCGPAKQDAGDRKQEVSNRHPCPASYLLLSASYFSATENEYGAASGEVPLFLLGAAPISKVMVPPCCSIL